MTDIQRPLASAFPQTLELLWKNTRAHMQTIILSYADHDLHYTGSCEQASRGRFLMRATVGQANFFASCALTTKGDVSTRVKLNPLLYLSRAALGDESLWRLLLTRATQIERMYTPRRSVAQTRRRSGANQGAALPSLTKFDATSSAVLKANKGRFDNRHLAQTLLYLHH